VYVQLFLTVYNLSDEREENLFMYIFCYGTSLTCYPQSGRNEVFNFSRTPQALCIAVSVLLSTVVEDYILMCLSLSLYWRLTMSQSNMNPSCGCLKKPRVWSWSSFSDISTCDSAMQLHSDKVALTFMRDY